MIPRRGHLQRKGAACVLLLTLAALESSLILRAPQGKCAQVLQPREARGAEQSLATIDSRRAVVLASDRDAVALFDTVTRSEAGVRGFLQRTGGIKSVLSALVAGGVGGGILFGTVPLFGGLAPVMGASAAVYAIQLPEGDAIGEKARLANRKVLAMWNALTSSSD
mmetsp:Transcript_37498/g.86516  ORF Transcript_37498/g.86516 Transcript_37498/m.86516 type:complete len:166 (+) Transcript_37498:64-561(+)